MNHVPEGLPPLLRSLAERITSSTHPVWPIPIFEAESYLYKYFLRRLLTVIDSLLNRPIAWPDIAALFYMPSRVVEFCYLFLGLRFSGLGPSERIRLAAHLIKVLSCLRPYDTFCEDGVNRLADQDHVASLTREQRVLKSSDERRLVSRISAALFSMCEFIHVGIPQYGRELHGPYVVEPGRFTLFRLHYDLRLSELWLPLEQFPFDEIEIVETYRGTPNMAQLDLTNHLTLSAGLHARFEKVVIRGRWNGTVRAIENWEWLLKVIVGTLDTCLKSAGSFTRVDWLRKHLEARCLYLKPHCELISHSHRPTHEEYNHLKDLPLSSGIEKTLAGTFDEVFTLMCSDFGMAAK